MQTIIDAAMPHLFEALAVLLTGVITWASARARKKWGIDIEEKHRLALHSALMTAARLALQHGLTGKKAVDMIEEYARQSVPDAMAALKPAPGVLVDLARAKMAEAAADRLGEALKHAGAA